MHSSNYTTKFLLHNSEWSWFCWVLLLQQPSIAGAVVVYQMLLLRKKVAHFWMGSSLNLWLCIFLSNIVICLSDIATCGDCELVALIPSYVCTLPFVEILGCRLCMERCGLSILNSHCALLENSFFFFIVVVHVYFS